LPPNNNPFALKGEHFRIRENDIRESDSTNCIQAITDWELSALRVKGLKFLRGWSIILIR